MLACESATACCRQSRGGVVRNQQKALEPVGEPFPRYKYGCMGCPETLPPYNYLKGLTSTPGAQALSLGMQGLQGSPSNSRNFSSLPVCRDQA